MDTSNWISESDLQVLCDRIARSEDIYRRTIRREMSKFPALSGLFPPYLSGCFLTHVFIVREGIVLSRMTADSDHIEFTVDDQLDLKRATGFDNAVWAHVQQQIRDQFGPDAMSRPWAIQIRANELAEIDRGRHGAGNGLLVFKLVTTHFDLEQWSAPLTQSEAIADVHTAVTAQHLGVGDLSTAKSPEEVSDKTIERLRSIIETFRSIIHDSTDERPLQEFLQTHPILLALDVSATHPQFKLGDDYITDFVMERGHQQYVFVEIEASTHRLYTQSAKPKNRKTTSGFEHAVQQVEDWLGWIERNLTYLEEKLVGINRPECWVIIGRTPTDRTERRKLDQKRKSLHGIRVFTYDDLLERAERQLSNLERNQAS